MDVTMLKKNMTVKVARLIAVALFAVFLAAPIVAEAQVVVVANGSPITELDIAHRSKLISSATHKAPTRQEVISELIDDRIKIAKAKVYGFEVTDAEVNESFATMAKRQGITPQQFEQILDHEGITANALKARVRAEMTWQQLVRGKFNSTLNVGDSDIAVAMRSRSDDAKDKVGYVYTLYPVMVVVPSGSGAAIMDAKRREADNLRSRFLSCAEGLAMARAVRDVAVREPITRSSADLSPQFRDLLGSMEVGRLSTPDVTPQGLQMFALCGKKESTADSPAKREMREQIFTTRFEAESKKFLEEVRKQAMIEYK
jgi:peptidyl-prolyl cis-trans isomerase SurA